MATFAARRLHTMLDNVDNIVAIELLAAAQGIDFHHPKKSSPALEKVRAMIRKVSPPYTEDRSLATDVTRVSAMIDSGSFCDWAASILPSTSQ